MNQLFDAITWNLNGIGIEQESFRRIDAEAAPEIARFSDAEWLVARRLCIRPRICDSRSARIRNNAVEAGLAALRRGALIYSDSNMIKSGLSIPKLKRIS